MENTADYEVQARPDGIECDHQMLHRKIKEDLAGVRNGIDDKLTERGFYIEMKSIEYLRTVSLSEASYKGFLFEDVLGESRTRGSGGSHPNGEGEPTEP